ncbi:MAG: type II toxin-antitoxin system RelE/ParE family toxin [Chitinivibrionales bacterium]|nr:type II toxin-antitoxin system RelE/ParE family toxin [Chitinivibrionales bacterium]
MPYTVQFEKSALKALKKLPQNIIPAIWHEIESLKINPRPPGCKRLTATDHLYRIRSGDYRIVYTIRDKILLVLIVRIGNRKEVYRKL